jgi:hypothetical protein
MLKYVENQLVCQDSRWHICDSDTIGTFSGPEVRQIGPKACFRQYESDIVDDSYWLIAYWVSKLSL